MHSNLLSGLYIAIWCRLVYQHSWHFSIPLDWYWCGKLDWHMSKLSCDRISTVTWSSAILLNCSHFHTVLSVNGFKIYYFKCSWLLFSSIQWTYSINWLAYLVISKRSRIKSILSMVLKYIGKHTNKSCWWIVCYQSIHVKWLKFVQFNVFDFTLWLNHILFWVFIHF